MHITLNKHLSLNILQTSMSPSNIKKHRTSSSLNTLQVTNIRVILLSLAISLLVINNLPPQDSIFILCDNSNHHSHRLYDSETNQEVPGSTTPVKYTTSTTTTVTSANERLEQKDTKNDINGNNNSNNKQFISRGDVYFLISEPESLRYTFKARSSRIGVPFTNRLANIALVLAEPRDACASTINKLEIRGNIALVERGGCSFLEKCIEIERSGGIALIVYDYDKHNDENYIEMVDDNTSRNCSIPAVSLLGKDGYMIVHSLLALKLNRAVITIPINVAKDEVSNPPWLMW